MDRVVKSGLFRIPHVFRQSQRALELTAVLHAQSRSFLPAVADLRQSEGVRCHIVDLLPGFLVEGLLAARLKGLYRGQTEGFSVL